MIPKGKYWTWLQLPCPAGGVTVPGAIMVQWVTVLDAEISPTPLAGQFHHFSLSAARAFALIGEDLRWRGKVCLC